MARIGNVVIDLLARVRGSSDDHVIGELEVPVSLSLSSGGYTVKVEQAIDRITAALRPNVVSDEMVSTFKAAWHQADEELRGGSRVRSGLEAVFAQLREEDKADRPAPIADLGGFEVQNARVRVTWSDDGLRLECRRRKCSPDGGQHFFYREVFGLPEPEELVRLRDEHVQEFH